MPLAMKYSQQLDRLNQISASRFAVSGSIKQIADNGDPKDSTRLVRLSEIKSYLKTIGRHEWVDLVQFPEGLVDRVNQERETRLSQRQNIIIPRWYLREFNGFANSDDAVELLIWVLYVSGRRISEIMESQFSDVGINLIMTTSLKKKRSFSCDTFRIMHPYTASDWLDSVETVREHFKELSLNAVTRGVSRYLKQEFHHNLSTHKLRGIYANVMWIKDGSVQIKDGYIKQILCLESLDIAINYSSYIIE